MQYAKQPSDETTPLFNNSAAKRLASFFDALLYWNLTKRTRTTTMIDRPCDPTQNTEQQFRMANALWQDWAAMELPHSVRQAEVCGNREIAETSAAAVIGYLDDGYCLDAPIHDDPDLNVYPNR